MVESTSRNRDLLPLPTLSLARLSGYILFQPRTRYGISNEITLSVVLRSFIILITILRLRRGIFPVRSRKAVELLLILRFPDCPGRGSHRNSGASSPRVTRRARKMLPTLPAAAIGVAGPEEYDWPLNKGDRVITGPRGKNQTGPYKIAIARVSKFETVVWHGCGVSPRPRLRGSAIAAVGLAT